MFARFLLLRVILQISYLSIAFYIVLMILSLFGPIMLPTFKLTTPFAFLYPSHQCQYMNYQKYLPPLNQPSFSSYHRKTDSLLAKQ